MDLELGSITADELARYAAVPITFTVRSVLVPRLIEGGLGGIQLAEQALTEPYLKDYDATEKPTDWPKRFDTQNWHFVLALSAGQAVGAAAVAVDTPGVHLLRGQRDLASLWDIRVAPQRRGQGIGSALFHHAADWARSRGCSLLQVETQNINTPACRFYHKMGCTLGTIDRYFYHGSAYAHEICLLWYLPLKSTA